MYDLNCVQALLKMTAPILGSKRAMPRFTKEDVKFMREYLYWLAVEVQKQHKINEKLEAKNKLCEKALADIHDVTRGVFFDEDF